MLKPGDTFEWKNVPFVVINKPVGRIACNHCDLWVGGFCIADENTPPCLNRGIAFKSLDNKKLKKLTTKNMNKLELNASKEPKFTGMYDDKGFQIYVGDRLLSEWGYEVIVEEIGGEYYGKLICEPGHSCEDIPYALNNGDGYIKQ